MICDAVIKHASEPNRDPSPRLISIAVSGTSSGTGGANLGSRSGLKWRADSHSTIELGERLGLSVIAEGIEERAF
jgi:hypothetical protein